MTQNVLILIGSLLGLTVGAEALVRGSVGIARFAGLSSFFIGLTIVGFGTSTPELFTSLTAALNDQDDIAVGNCIGSNIFNIAVILGVTALICPIPVKLHLVKKEVAIVIGVAFVPLAVILSMGELTRIHGLVMVALLVVYVWRGYFEGKCESKRSGELLEHELESELGLRNGKSAGAFALHIVFVVIGLAVLVVGSKYFVSSASDIARSLGVSDLAIGLTIVAAGTSAPELVTSLVAALRKQSDISIGNILGSNIFNILGILGLTAIIKPQTVTFQTLVLDTPVMIAASLALLPIMSSHARISRTEGAILVAAYAIYAYVLFAWAPKLFGA